MANQPIELSQENKLGSKSTQIAQQNNYYGMDYQNTKALCLDLIKNELAIYKEEAEQTVRERYEKFSSTFLEKLNNENITDQKMCEEFKNPDMQYTYVQAQKAYIRLGTPELENILSNLLVDRAKEDHRSLLQIALAEAITVVPMLLPEQLDILALCFKLRYTQRLNMNNFVSFIDYMNNQIIPHVRHIEYKESFFQHLVYTKSGSIDIGEITIESILSNTYGGLFLSGYTQEDLNNFPQRFPELFTTCLQNPTKLQINAINANQLNEKLDSMKDISPNDKKYIQEHFLNNLMSTTEIKNWILEKVPNSKYLFKQWNETSLKHLTLTSVGIILGANRSKQITGLQFNMNIWI